MGTGLILRFLYSPLSFRNLTRLLHYLYVHGTSSTILKPLSYRSGMLLHPLSYILEDKLPFHVLLIHQLLLLQMNMS